MEELAASLGTLPSVPQTYQALCAELERASSMASIARVLERDVAVSSRLLQVVNSALYALPRKVGSLAQALGLLGLKAVRDLVLAIEVFDGLGQTSVPGFSLEALQAESHTRGSLARALAPSALRDHAYTAGLMGDIGRMVLLARAPDRYVACTYLTQTGMPLDEAEAEVFGVPSRALGAFLLSTWGLPEEVVQAVGRPASPGLPTVAGLVALAERFQEEARHEKEHDEVLFIVTREMLAPLRLAPKADLARALARTMAQGLLEPPVRGAA